MKKRTMKILSVAMAVICMSMPVLAADEPPVWFEDGVMPFGNTFPYLQLRLPGNSGTFSYDIPPYGEQYSDFIIIPESVSINIKIQATTTAASHTMTIRVRDRADDTIIYSDIMAVTQNGVEEISLPYGSFVAYRGYYIELSSPSISHATGTMTVFSE